MVLKGQYLERSVTVRSGSLHLDALFHRGTREPPCLIASPHPAMGGSMVAPAIAELAWALTRAGHPTLRFDYRGVGASQGESSHLEGSLGGGARRLDGAALSLEREDLLAAADQLRASAGRPGDGLCAVGYSFGAAVVLSAADDPRISSLILVAPPTALADFSALARVKKPTLVLCAHHDALCDRGSLQLGPEALLEVIAHSDHSFRRGLTELGRAAAAFLRKPGEEPVVEPQAPDEPDALSLQDLELPEGDEPPLELDDS